MYVKSRYFLPPLPHGVPEDFEALQHLHTTLEENKGILCSLKDYNPQLIKEAQQVFKEQDHHLEKDMLRLSLSLYLLDSTKDVAISSNFL